MEKLVAFFVLAIAANVVVGRPQTNSNDVQDRFGAIIIIPNQGGFFPGQGGNFPGQGGNFPGQGGNFPGQGGNFPGQGGNFPGQGGNFPGQGGNFPGQGGNFPGQGGNFPGQGGNFPGQGGNFPGQGGTFPRPQPATSTVAPSGSTTLSSTVDECIRNCPVTTEYNPVCGTNNVLYPNPGRLLCAQNCGVSVSLLRAAPCPPSTPAPTS